MIKVNKYPNYEKNNFRLTIKQQFITLLVIFYLTILLSFIQSSNIILKKTCMPTYFFNTTTICLMILTFSKNLSH